MIIPVILCGGSGTRLWPMSRELYPKQFLPLVGSRTMLQDTIVRLQNIGEIHNPIFICNEEHRFLLAEQVRQLDVNASAIILEPEGRSTAPAVAVAAMKALEDYQDPLLFVLPADHVIKDMYSFQESILTGIKAAQTEKLVTFGVVPTREETGYGYIKKGNELYNNLVYEENPKGKTNHSVFEVASFIEKPELKKAQEYVRSGDYLWNSGMFLFQSSKYLQELECLAPEICNTCRQAFERSTLDLDFLRLHKESFLNSPSDSIDYAVMEKTENAVVVSLDSDWSDVGSWSALWELENKDSENNVLRGDIILHEVQNSYIFAQDRTVAALGLEDIVVVETPDAILVANREKVQDVKKIVNKLKKEHREEALVHKRVYRPWGSYEGISRGERFQVKRIIIEPGAVLSLQKHFHRSEHWVVVKGTANVTCGEEEFLLTEDQSVYIPLGKLHRLENPGKIPLEIIEVQTGSYLGEDDIMRVQDMYGREKK